MVSCVVDHALATVNGKRGLARNVGGDFHDFSQHGGLVRVHVIHEPSAFGFFSRHSSAGVTKLANDTLGYQFDQTWKSAHIGSHTDINFIDRKKGLGAGIAHVTCCGEINATTNTASLDGR